MTKASQRTADAEDSFAIYTCSRAPRYSSRQPPGIVGRLFSVNVVLLGCFLSGTAWAQDPPPASLAFRNTSEMWAGRGLVPLNKLQVSATLEGKAFGFGGWKVHGQVLRTDGDSLSARVGDIQTVTSIDAINTTRLFEAWIERDFTQGKATTLSIRAGLVDLNADFDSIEPASLFVNSSHGIGADLARSGLDGPSIFPVTSVGARAAWTLSDTFTVKGAIFDGVSGDPDHPRSFVAARLEARDGLLRIGQADLKLTDDITLSAGVWGYTKPLLSAALIPGPPKPGRGAFVSASSATPKKEGLAWWVRLGGADARAQVVDGYLGAGLVYKGFGHREDDRMGFAVARASIGDDARRASMGLPRAETTWETSYQAKLGQTFAIQPDVQYVDNPAGRPRAHSALVTGLRLIVTGGFPKKAAPEDATDPTVPPDTPPSAADPAKAASPS